MRGSFFYDWVQFGYKELTQSINSLAVSTLCCQQRLHVSVVSDKHKLLPNTFLNNSHSLLAIATSEQPWILIGALNLEQVSCILSWSAVLVNYLLSLMMIQHGNFLAFSMATKTGQTGYDQPITLRAATTFEECITCHPCEDQRSSMEWLLMTALTKWLKEITKCGSMLPLLLISRVGLRHCELLHCLFQVFK